MKKYLSYILIIATLVTMIPTWNINATEAAQSTEQEIANLFSSFTPEVRVVSIDGELRLHHFDGIYVDAGINLPDNTVFENEIYTYKGDLVKVVTGRLNDNIIVKSKLWNKRIPLKIRLRLYTDVNGNRYYTKWSKFKYISNLTLNKPKVQKDSCTISWKKIQGAKSYKIYLQNNFGFIVKKIGTTTKTSFNIKKIGKNKLKKRIEYRVAVYPVIKIKGKNMIVHHSNYRYFTLK